VKCGMSSKRANLFIVVLLILLIECTGVAPEHRDEKSNENVVPSDDYIIDEIEEFTFDDVEEQSGDPRPEVTSLPGAAFRIHLSSFSYRVEQLRYFNRLSLVRNDNREGGLRSIAARYNRTDSVRSAHVLISIFPSTGTLKQYRLIKSTYIKELDALIMKDLSTMRFSIVRNKIPSVLYIAYTIQLSDQRR